MLTLRIIKVRSCSAYFDCSSPIIDPRKGKTRIDRLYLIGTTSSYLYLEALKAAIAEAKRGKDVNRYEMAVAALRDIAPGDPDAKLDQLWVTRTQAQVQADTEKLEQELRGYKNNLIKESIRVCPYRRDTGEGRNNKTLLS